MIGYTSLEMSLIDSTWTHSSNLYQFEFSLPSFKSQQLALGVKNSPQQKDNFYIGYQFPWGQESSLTLKWLQENLYFIKSGKTSFSLDYLTLFHLSQITQIYFSFGYFYRWLKQRWDHNPYSPFAFKTNDHEGFISGIIGLKRYFNKSFLTFDFNTKDSFSNYNFDNVGMDLSFHWNLTTTSFFILTFKTRFTALLTGTGVPSTYQGGIKFNKIF